MKKLLLVLSLVIVMIFGAACSRTEKATEDMDIAQVTEDITEDEIIQASQ